MILRSLLARGFRNLEEREVSFHPDVNLILGDNGHGKTNLLEAIYCLGTTRSFRVRTHPPLFRVSSTGALFLQGEVERENVNRTLSFGLEQGVERRRELRVNAEKVTLSRYLRELSLFAFASVHLATVRGTPEDRRRFLDRGIASNDPGHIDVLSRFQRTLRQRNAVLHSIRAGKTRRQQLDPWDAEFSRFSADVVRARRTYVTALLKHYLDLSEESGFVIPELEITYRAREHEEDQSANRRVLEQSLQKDLSAGHTTTGPHRDDLELIVRGMPAADLLSSGEIKTLVLLLELAKVRLFTSSTGERPLFLLDDVDAELDLHRIGGVLRSVCSLAQTFATSPKDGSLVGFETADHARFEMRSGRVVDRGKTTR